MFGLASVFALVAKNLRLIELKCEFCNRVLYFNTTHFAVIFTFFHCLPLIIKTNQYNHSFIFSNR